MASRAPVRRLIAAIEAKIRADNTERIAYEQEMAVIRELEQRFAIRHYGRAVAGDWVERLIRHLHDGVLITDRTWQETKEIDAEAAERKRRDAYDVDDLPGNPPSPRHSLRLR